jgi:DNA-binding PadR family transcriptional regulator
MTKFKRIVLAVLKDGSGQPLELTDRIANLPSPPWFIRGRIYVALHELVDEGFVSSTPSFENLEVRGGTPRFIYELTPKGIAEVRTHHFQEGFR